MNRKYRKAVIAGNWKMNQTASGIKPFMDALKEELPQPRPCEIVLCTPAVMIPAMIRAGKDCKVAAGGQDVSKYEKGAYTGEISADQLADIGAKYCIVGHSERRQYHHEDDMLINAKAKALLEKGIIPIICVGESLATAEQAQEVCEAIRGVIRKMYGARPARAVSILYGGSMNAKNAAELLAQPDIDGGLIGGASLKPADFAAIVKATNQ